MQKLSTYSVRENDCFVHAFSVFTQCLYSALFHQNVLFLITIKHTEKKVKAEKWITNQLNKKIWHNPALYE